MLHTLQALIKRHRYWIAMLMLLGVQVTATALASRRMSPAMDEAAHLWTGLAMLTHGRYVDAAHAEWTIPDKLKPPMDAVYALAAHYGAGLPLNDGQQPYIAFRAILAARWVSHLAGAAALVLVYLWGRRLWGRAGGLFAAVLAALNPLFLAHATIVSSDLMGMLGGLLAAWAIWRVWMEGRAAAGWGWRLWAGALATGAAAGLSLAFKMSNLILIVALPLAIVWGAWLARQRGNGPAWLGRGAAAAAVAMATALCVASAAYGWMNLYDRVPLRLLGRERIWPMGQELAVCASWATQLADHAQQTVFYKGWIQPPSIRHYLAAILYKTPLALLALWALGVPAALRHGWRRRDAGAQFLVLLAGAIAIVFMTRGFYLGLRHLLLPLTLAAILAGALEIPSAMRPWLWRGGVLFLMFCSLAPVVAGWPWHLSYFNRLAGERLVLVDFDSDWGQGLIELAAWQRRHGGDAPLWLSYFGDSRPEDYGVRYRGLLSPYSGVTQDPQWEKGSDPARLTGWVAISATQLAGPHMALAVKRVDYYAQWLKLTPAAKIAGGTIWIYDRRKP